MTENTSDKVAIVVGAGHASAELSTQLRMEGWAGRIVVIGEESYLPYQRPPLSKAFLSGAAKLEDLFLRPQATYDDARIEVITNTRVVSIDRAAKTVQLDDGRTMAYDRLALTTGGRVRRLGVPDIERAEAAGNFHYLRTVADVERLQPQCQPGKRVVIVGGGFVGLEVAAVAIKLGLHVTLLEASPRVLVRVTAPEISAFYERVHREAGVDLHVGVEVAGFEFDSASGAITALKCKSGLTLSADLVIVGVGLIPNTELAQAAGLEVDNGIVVDALCRTSDPSVVAAGDCTSHPNVFVGRRLRLESVPNAVEQGRTAASTLCGKERPYKEVPWFWSEQYDLRLQMVGLSQGYDQFVVRGSTADRRFSAFYLKDGRVIAADAVSKPVDFMMAKRLVAERHQIDPAALADESVPLKSLLAPAA